jgi:hypothetical protein
MSPTGNLNLPGKMIQGGKVFLVEIGFTDGNDDSQI